MNREIVHVIERQQDGVWVEAVQRSACQSCSVRSGCGQSALQQLGRPMRLWVAAPNHRLSVGDEAVLVMPEGGVALSALTLYGLPLLAMIAGSVLGQAWLGELTALLGAGLGLLLGFGMARYCAARHSWQPRLDEGGTNRSELNVINPS